MERVFGAACQRIKSRCFGDNERRERKEEIPGLQHGDMYDCYVE